MKWDLNGGSAEHLYSNKFFFKKLKQNQAKSLLMIADHHPLGPKHSIDRFLAGEPKVKKLLDLTFFTPTDHLNKKYQIQDFDALYIVGGEYPLWDKNVVAKSSSSLVTEIKRFLYKENGCYLGSSAGLQLMFRAFHSEMEKGYEHESVWYENGFDLMGPILTEVHYDSKNNMKFLKDRHLQTLKDHPEFEFGVLFSGDCVIEVDSTTPQNWKILNGSYEMNKYHCEL